MLRLYLRRDRVSLPLWVLLLSVPLATVYVGSVEKVYPTQAARAGFAASIMASPAQRALYGQVYNDSLGAVGIWKAGMFHLLIAVAVILTVIRHTRADEETGRTELVDAQWMFVFIGAAPLTDWLEGAVLRDSRGFILTGPDLATDGRPPAGWELDRAPYHLETNIPGVFVAGDARAESAKRVASAVGEGAMAVMLVHRYLEKI